MKKLLVFVGVVVAFSLALFSCENQEPLDLHGYWQVTAISGAPEGTDFTAGDWCLGFDFQDNDTTFVIRGEDGESLNKGTYMWNGDSLEIYIFEETEATDFDFMAFIMGYYLEEMVPELCYSALDSIVVVNRINNDQIQLMNSSGEALISLTRSSLPESDMYNGSEEDDWDEETEEYCSDSLYVFADSSAVCP